MYRSSESIAAIAAALAKAQSALVNPEKSMTATIREEGRGQSGERMFRYAPLSAGLELVRKALSQHELAVVQTTSIDEASRMVRLNTVLAHSSGQWISSDWPICPISDMNTPHRMGAALTYARRYSLFTLVGIAGEDDLDAPDLNAGSVGSARTVNPPSSGDPPAPTRHSGNGRAPVRGSRSPAPHAPRPVLPPHDSARLRTAMLADIEVLSPQAATAWAGQMLASKNRLMADDARAVEQAFEARFATIVEEVVEVASLVPSEAPPSAPACADPQKIDAAEHPSTGASANADTVLVSNASQRADVALAENRLPLHPLGKTVRHRDKEHLRFLRTQPCLVCGRQPSDPHHLRFAQPQALGRKVSDEFTVPLCRTHHREAHRASREIAWWQSQGIAPMAAAEALWRKSQSGQAISELEPQPEQPAKRPAKPKGRGGNAVTTQRPIGG
jgi:hypothetical protein